MGLREIFNINKKTTDLIPNFSVAGSVKEKFKGFVEKQEHSHNKNLGEKHPFDFEELLKLYRVFPIAFGAVDKTVDYIVGSGFFVKSDDPRAEEIIAQFIKDQEFDSLLRNWIKVGLITGNSFIEISGSKEETPDKLKVLSPVGIFVKRDEMGEVLGYNQLKPNKSPNDRESFIPFDEFEVAHLKINALADSAYGIGILFPCLVTVNNLLKAEKDMGTLLSRKANSPLIFLVGDKDKQLLPTEGDITELTNKLVDMKNDQEWVLSALVDPKVVDFGNLSEKFEIPFRHYEDHLLFALQVPEVLMGRAVPMAVAPVQMETFQRRIQSLQVEIEKVIEQKIFKRVLEANGFNNVYVEFEWGQPSDQDRRLEVDKITALLSNPLLSVDMRIALEDRLVSLLKIEVDVDSDRQREKEKKEPQPRVPGQQSYNLFISEGLKEDYTLEEWINNESFNFKSYLNKIEEYLVSDEAFSDLKAKTKTERIAGKLSPEKISKLKEIFIDSFNEGSSIIKITKRIENEVSPGALHEIKNKKIGKVLVSSESRSELIARTETIKASNEGALKHFKSDNIERVQWLAATGPRTDPDCLALNGKIFTIDQAQGRIPLHPNCRCTWIPVLTEKISNRGIKNG